LGSFDLRWEQNTLKRPFCHAFKGPTPPRWSPYHGATLSAIELLSLTVTSVRLVSGLRLLG
jgi:hypothetical protein